MNAIPGNCFLKDGQKTTSKRARIIVTVTIAIAVAGILAFSVIYFLAYRDACIRPRSSVSGNENKERVPCLSKAIGQKMTTSLVGNRVQTHVAFVKVHKSASSTLQNIFYRFGDVRDLSFILPDIKERLRFSVRRGEHEILIPPFEADTYDIMANHAVFDEEIFSNLLHNDTTYLAIVREPTRNFVSGAIYFRYRWPDKYLTAIPEKDMLYLLIRYPEKYEPEDLRTSYTYNIQANDLGLTLDKIMRLEDKKVNAYLDKLNDKFSLVLLADYFDESLVLMKRYLNWQLEDILYITINAFDRVPKPNLTNEDIAILRERNYLDYKFYDFFHDRFWKQFRCERLDIYDEIILFKRVKESITYYCVKADYTAPFIVKASKWNKELKITDVECQDMMTEEMVFFTKLQKKQRDKVLSKFGRC